MLAELERRYGPWVVFRLSQRPTVGSAVIATGSLGLDYATGVGGLPRGRVTEFFGPPTSGKTTVAAHLLASAQRQRGFVALIDASHGFDLGQLSRCGVNLNNLLLVVPQSAREAMDIASLLVASEGLDALVLSAANHLVAGPGSDPAAFAEGLRRLVAELGHAPTVVIVVVHDEPRWHRVGRNAARALAHAATLRIAFRPLRLVTHASGDVLGLRLRAEVVKNKLAPAGRSAEIEVWHDRGLHLAAELFELGLVHGLIATQPGYSFAGTWLGRTRAAAIQALACEPTVAAALREALVDGPLRLRHDSTVEVAGA